MRCAGCSTSCWTGRPTKVQDGQWLTRQEAARYLTDLGFPISAGTLQNLKTKGKGPPYRIFDFRVHYTRIDLEDWANARVEIIEPEPSTPCKEGFWLYRHYDADGALLYVGMTHDFHQRQKQHRLAAAWFHAVARITAERHESERAVLNAEYLAIINEKPLHNRQAYPPREQHADPP